MAPTLLGRRYSRADEDADIEQDFLNGVAKKGQRRSAPLCGPGPSQAMTQLSVSSPEPAPAVLLGPRVSLCMPAGCSMVQLLDAIGGDGVPDSVGSGACGGGASATLDKYFVSGAENVGKEVDCSFAVRVHVHIEVLELSDIDSQAETFSAVYKVELRWVEQALHNFNSRITVRDPQDGKLRGLVGCVLSRSVSEVVIRVKDSGSTIRVQPWLIVEQEQPNWRRLFFPKFSVTNHSNIPQELVESKIALLHSGDMGGTVQYMGLYRGVFREPMHLRSFPFDRQLLRIRLMAEAGLDRVQFVPGSKRGVQVSLQDSGWELAAEMQARCGLYIFSAVLGPSQAEAQQHSHCHVTIHVERRCSAWLLRGSLLWVLSLFSACAFAAEDRPLTLMVMLLVELVYGGLMTRWSPRKSYFTLLDAYVAAVVLFQLLLIFVEVVLESGGRDTITAILFVLWFLGHLLGALLALRPACADQWLLGRCCLAFAASLAPAPLGRPPWRAVYEEKYDVERNSDIHRCSDPERGFSGVGGLDDEPTLVPSGQAQHREVELRDLPVQCADTPVGAKEAPPEPAKELSEQLRHVIRQEFARAPQQVASLTGLHVALAAVEEGGCHGRHRTHPTQSFTLEDCDFMATGSSWGLPDPHFSTRRGPLGADGALPGDGGASRPAQLRQRRRSLSAPPTLPQEGAARGRRPEEVGSHRGSQPGPQPGSQPGSLQALAAESMDSAAPPTFGPPEPQQPQQPQQPQPQQPQPQQQQPLQQQQAAVSAARIPSVATVLPPSPFEMVKPPEEEGSRGSQGSGRSAPRVPYNLDSWLVGGSGPGSYVSSGVMTSEVGSARTSSILYPPLPSPPGSLGGGGPPGNAAHPKAPSMLGPGVDGGGNGFV